MTYNKKGQAAMEFLMTYGWAILAAIIAIGVLAYFGVFNPSRLAGSAAVLNAPMNVDSFNILNDGCSAPAVDCLNLEITQNSGQTIYVNTANITLTSGAAQGAACSATLNGAPLGGAWTSGTRRIIQFNCSNGAGQVSTIYTAGASIAGNIEMKYYTASSGLNQTSTGNVRGVSQ